MSENMYNSTMLAKRIYYLASAFALSYRHPTEEATRQNVQHIEDLLWELCAMAIEEDKQDHVIEA